MRKNQFDKCEEWPAGRFRIKQTNITSFLGYKILLFCVILLITLKLAVHSTKVPRNLLNFCYSFFMIVTFPIFAIERHKKLTEKSLLTSFLM